MVSNIPKLVAAVCPDVFCQRKALAKVKRELRDYLWLGSQLAYLKAAALAEPVEPNTMALSRLVEQNPFKLPGQRSPVEQHTLILDHTDEPLEPIYFNLLDDLQAREGWRVTKLVDTVEGTHGAGFSSDLTRRVQQQQHNAAELTTRMQNQIRALLTQWQKWREQKDTLKTYAAANGPDGPDRDTALWALQTRWRRSANPELQSDALKSAAAAFERWRQQSERELRGQLAVDQQLLKNQLQFLKLQAGWLKPYLQPHQTKQSKGDPDLVTAFNTAIFEVVLLVEPASDLEHSVRQGELPRMLLGKRHRRPKPVLMVELRFRAIPERTKSASYAYRGRAELTFTSYALKDDELTVFVRELQRSEWGEVLGLLEHDTTTNFDSLLSDLDELLAEPPAEPKAKLAAREETNPISALFSLGELFRASDGEAKPDVPTEPVKPDTDVEQVLRSVALLEARALCVEMYRKVKRHHHLPTTND